MYAKKHFFPTKEANRKGKKQSTTNTNNYELTKSHKNIKITYTVYTL